MPSRRFAALWLVVLAAAAPACGAGAARTRAPAVTATPAPGSSTAPATSSSAPAGTPTRALTSSHAVAPRSTAPQTAPTTSPPPPSGNRPVIVIDPGHSVTVHATDPATGLDVSDYENEPEMRDVFAVAGLVRSKLVADGYRVILTKTTLDAPTSLGRRAAVANGAHAALALSIHDQAGSSGGVGFTQGNNTVYYQSVGDYRTTPGGQRVYFTDAAVAATSKRYGQIFQTRRSAAQGVPVSLLGNTGYDLATRGLPAGDIWLVQLLAHVPWIYNEAGGNSPGMVGLNAADEARYASGLAAAVEACVPIRH